MTQHVTLRGKTGRLIGQFDTLTCSGHEGDGRLCEMDIAGPPRGVCRSRRMAPNVGHTEPCVGHTEPCVGHMEPCVGHMEPCVGHMEMCLGHMELCVGYVELCVGCC